jgi:hypothetical protein
MMLYDMPNAPTTETLWTWDQDTAEPVERQLVVVAEAIGEAGRRRCLPSY